MRHRSAFALVLAAFAASPLHAQWTNRYTHVGTGHHVYLEGYEMPTLGAGPMDPAPSPDGSQIAVASRGWLWLVDRDSRVARQITDGGPLDSRPRWSPDGRHLVFVRDDGSDTWVVRKEIATGVETILVDTDAIELDPSYGPDGSLWYASGENGPIHVWRMDAAGARAEVAGEGRVARRPQVSADGHRLLFIDKRGADRIVIRDLSTATERVVYEGNILSQTEPALSPDGSLVAYNVPQAHGDGWELRLASLDRAGGTVVLAGGGDHLPLAPVFSADGQWVWFSEAGSDEIFRLYRVSVNGGPVEPFDIASWDASGTSGRVRLTTSDTGVDGPVAARVSITDGNGHPVFPAGRQPRFDGQTGRVFFYSPGVIDVDVPAGEVTVTVTRGLASPVTRRTVSVGPNALATVDVDVTPIWDAAAAGWVSGEQHFHLNYGGPYRLEPEDLRPVLAGEALDFAHPLVANLHERFGAQELFGWGPSGEAPIARFGQEVRSHFLGHIGLIGTTELFWPWVWGPGYQVYGTDDRTNAEVTAHARRQGGLATYVHPSGADPFANPRAPGLPVELIADGVLGDVDALEIACLWTDELGTAEVWYHLLNLGHPVAATAGSDVMLNFYRTMAPGVTRMYVHTDGARDFDSYLRALKAGRSFVTNGPLMEFAVDGARPGDVTDADGSVEWTLALHTAVPVSRIEVLVNGVVAWSGAASNDALQELHGTLDIPAGGWVAARVTGPATTAWPAMDSYAFAHTSPVWIDHVGSTDRDAELRSATVLSEALAGARQRLEAGYAGAPIPKLTTRFDEARAVLEGTMRSR